MMGPPRGGPKLLDDVDALASLPMSSRRQLVDTGPYGLGRRPCQLSGVEIEVPAIVRELKVISLGLGSVHGRTVSCISRRVELHEIFFVSISSISADPVDANIGRRNLGISVLSERVTMRLYPSAPYGH